MFQPKGNARRKEEPARRVVPTAGDLMAGRDFDWNDRVGMIRALSTGKNIFIPNIGKPFQCDGPVYGFHDNQYLYGVDTGLVINSRMASQAVGLVPTTRAMLKADFQGGPLVLLASAQNFGAPSAETWVNLGGVLDRSCRPEKRFGLRMFGGLQRAIFYSDGFQSGGSAGVGDFWQGKTYTIAVAFMPFNQGSTSNAWTRGADIVGSGDVSGGVDAYPWYLRVVEYPDKSNNLHFHFRYYDAAGFGRSVYWPYPKSARLFRVYIMADFDRIRFDRTISVYMDTGAGAKKQTFVHADAERRGGSFARGFYAPFSIGHFSMHYNRLADPHRPRDDFVLCGLHIENQLTYKDNGSGGMVRADSAAPVQDDYAFFTPRGSTSGLLPLTSKGGPLPNEIEEVHQGGRGVGFLLHNISPNAYVNGVGLYNLSLYSNQLHPESHYQGDALAIGQILNCYVRGCSFSGGACAVRMWNSAGNLYYMRFADLQAQGGAAVFCGQNADVCFDDVEMVVGNDAYGFYFTGTTLRLTKIRVPTCYKNVRNIVCLDSTPGENNPNDLSIIDFNDDNEGQAWPTDATIRVNNGVRVRIQGASMGSLALPGPTNPAGSPFLALGPIGKSTPGAVKGHADLENVAPYGPPIGGAAMIRVEDPDWCVVVRNSTACTGIYGYLQDLTGGRCSARIEHLDLGSIPPRWGTVWAGKHEVRSSPLPGQYAEWRCLVGGTHGSGSLPVWAGLYPNVAPRSNQIAAYSMSYIGVVGEPFLNGVLNDTIVDSLIRRVFGRSPWNPPVAVDASLHVGLISLYRFARDPKQFTEASSPSIQEIRIRNNAGITGGTFRLSFKGRSTPPLAAHSASGEILRALEASPSVGERNVHVENNNVYLDNSNKMVITFKNDLGSEDQPLVTIDASGLRGKDFSFETVSIARGGGYGRAAASFSKAARGSASNSGPIRFPAPSGPWNQGYPIHFWMLTTGSKPSSGTMMIAGELKNHVVIDKPNSAALGFDAGSLGVVHHASTQGGFTHHAADLVLNAILHGSAIEPPATWHIGLSATPVDPSGAGVVEPSGNGYSRIAVPNTHDHWIYNPFRFVAGAACNKSPIRFADPAGAWAEGRPLPHWFLADSPRGGTIWASGTFPVPVVVADRSDAAPNFAPETFFVILI